MLSDAEEAMRGAEMKKDAAYRRQGFFSDKASLFVVALFAVMLVGILILSAAGGSLFDMITESRTDNMNQRAALTYAGARITASDREGAVRAEHTQDGDILILSGASPASGYETHLYAKDGYLMESICESTAEGDTGEAVSGEEHKVAKTDLFSVSVDGQVVTLETDDGIRRIYLHSKEAAG